MKLTRRLAAAALALVALLPLGAPAATAAPCDQICQITATANEWRTHNGVDITVGTGCNPNCTPHVLNTSGKGTQQKQHPAHPEHPAHPAHPAQSHKH